MFWAVIEYTSMDNDNDRYYADWFTKTVTIHSAFSALDTNLLYGSKTHSKEDFALSRLMVSNHQLLLMATRQ